MMEPLYFLTERGRYATPLFESQCASPDCRHIAEWYAHTRETPDPKCQECGGETKRLISRFAAIYTKPISEYGDPGKETYAADIKRGGHWQVRKHSEGGTPDKPVPVFIDSVQKQREFVKAENLYDPSDVAMMQVDGSGQKCLTPMGQAGTWI